MRKTIKKEVLTSTIQGFKITVTDGKPTFEELPLLTVIGKADEKRALKELKENYGQENQYTVCEIKVEKNVYSTTITDFIKHATKLDTESKAN